MHGKCKCFVNVFDDVHVVRGVARRQRSGSGATSLLLFFLESDGRQHYRHFFDLSRSFCGVVGCCNVAASGWLCFRKSLGDMIDFNCFRGVHVILWCRRRRVPPTKLQWGYVRVMLFLGIIRGTIASFIFFGNVQILLWGRRRLQWGYVPVALVYEILHVDNNSVNLFGDVQAVLCGTSGWLCLRWCLAG